MFFELRRRSSTLLRKAAFGVPIFFGVQGFEWHPMGKPTGTPIFQLQHETSSYNKKNTTHFRVWCFLLNCGDRIWTCDLRVMSPTSYRTALLRGSIKNGRRRIRTFEAIATDLQSAPFGHSGIHPYNGIIFCLWISDLALPAMQRGNE